MCLIDSAFTDHEGDRRAPDQQSCCKPVTGGAASRGSLCGGMGARVGARVLAGASEEWARPVGSVGGDVRRRPRCGGLETPRHQRPRDHQLPGIHRRVVTDTVIRSEMPGTLDLPRGRIEKIWDAGKVGQEALAYADVLHNLARYLTGNDTDADDLVQETYARALQAAGQFTPGTNLKAWLFRIIRNTFISRYRRERNNPTVGGLDTVDSGALGPAEQDGLLGDIELDRLRKVVAGGTERALMSPSEDA